MNKFILDDAISQLDISLIAAYLRMEQEYLRRKAARKRRLVRWSAMAACLCLLVTFVVTNAPSWGFWQHPESGRVYYEGQTMKTGGTEVTLVETDFEAGICTFEINKKYYSKMYFVFNGMVILGQWTAENGAVCLDADDYDVITPCPGYTSKNKWIVVDNLLKITVNGQEADRLPFKAGKYTVVIDFSKMFEVMDHVSPLMSVNGVASFVIDTNMYW